MKRSEFNKLRRLFPDHIIQIMSDENLYDVLNINEELFEVHIGKNAARQISYKEIDPSIVFVFKPVDWNGISTEHQSDSGIGKPGPTNI